VPLLGFYVYPRKVIVGARWFVQKIVCTIEDDGMVIIPGELRDKKKPHVVESTIKRM
jgi:hypothetical protein